ncbi:MAG: hypothetical protein KDI51_14345, partial [Xanthomonadales bacterium]|nr:hypothetical protein [Xanthomonadales bacterium]
MSPEQLEAEHRAWRELSPTDQWLLRLIALEGWISEPAQIAIAWELLVGLSGAPTKAPVQAVILRQARLLHRWVDVRHQHMQATEALRRQALPEAETRQVATQRLQHEVRKLPVRWSPYGGHFRFSVVVSWLLMGAETEQPQTVHALPDHSILTRALRWILPPHHDPDLIKRLSSRVRREWVVDGYSAAVYATDLNLPYWRAQMRKLDPSDQAVVEHIPMMLDDSLLCGAQLAAELQPDWLDLSV